MIINLIKIFIPATLSFAIGLGITPILSHFFHKYKMWKKSSRSGTDNMEAVSEEFKKIHNEAGELSTPRIGGIIIWLSVLLVIILLYLISLFFPTDLTIKLNFLSRNQTLLPLITLIVAALIGLVDDMLHIMGKGSYTRDSIIYRKVKVATLVLIGLVIGWWFFYKLEVISVHIPFSGDLLLGVFFIPFFIIFMLGVFSGSVIDGIDGLSGGVLGSVFVAYTVIAFLNNQIDLAAFCSVLAGGILAFLWFNVPPARFYMGETGMLALTVTLAVVAFLTDTAILYPLIALPLFLTSLSVVIQMVAKKYFKKKVFRVAPLHHHFEALGWPKYKVVMRYWIISVICSIIGVVIAVIS